MTTTLNEDQTFDIPGRPVTDHVTITVMSVHYQSNYNGFSNIFFLGEQGTTDPRGETHSSTCRARG